MTALLEVENLVIRYPAMGRVRAAVSGQASEFDAVAGVTFVIEAGKTLSARADQASQPSRAR